VARTGALCRRTRRARSGRCSSGPTRSGSPSRVDDADLYFQTTRSEGWSLEEGIVKSGSFSIDQGVGVRAVAGEKTAFAYSDDISEAGAARDAARTVRTIAAAGQSRNASRWLPRAEDRPSRALYGAPTDPIATLDSTAEGGLLEKVERWPAPRTRAWCR
jgi:TldD protein